MYLEVIYHIYIHSIYIYIHIHVYTHIYIHAYIYFTHAYTYTHTIWRFYTSFENLIKRTDSSPSPSQNALKTLHMISELGLSHRLHKRGIL